MIQGQAAGSTPISFVSLEPSSPGLMFPYHIAKRGRGAKAKRYPAFGKYLALSKTRPPVRSS
jgi:hypothetical protein